MKSAWRQRRHILAAGIALAAGMLVLGGCASAPPAAPSAAAMASATRWSGRLSLRVDSTPPQQYSASFELSGNASAGELTLTSPFGQQLAQAQWRDGWAVLRRGDDERSYPDLDSLTTELTGTVLPIAALFEWLQGRPAPTEGWKVDLSQIGDGRLHAERHTPLPTATLRVVMP